MFVVAGWKQQTIAATPALFTSSKRSTCVSVQLLLVQWTFEEEEEEEGETKEPTERRAAKWLQAGSTDSNCGDQNGFESVLAVTASIMGCLCLDRFTEDRTNGNSLSHHHRRLCWKSTDYSTQSSDLCSPVRILTWDATTRLMFGPSVLFLCLQVFAGWSWSSIDLTGCTWTLASILALCNRSILYFLLAALANATILNFMHLLEMCFLW